DLHSVPTRRSSDLSEDAGGAKKGAPLRQRDPQPLLTTRPTRTTRCGRIVRAGLRASGASSASVRLSIWAEWAPVRGTSVPLRLNVRERARYAICPLRDL